MTEADAELKTASLSATEDALSKLGSDCTSLLATYEKLTDERRKQILQLQEVDSRKLYVDLTRLDLSADPIGKFAKAEARGTLAPAPHNPTMRVIG